MVNRNYTYDLKTNAEIARLAEEITIQLLHQIYPNNKFYSVHDDPEFYHKGDIITQNGKTLDAKDDGRIHDTNNVFCEECKRFYNSPDKLADGWMRNGEYDFLCVVDRYDKKLYILNFKKLKRIYKQFRDVQTDMGDCISYGFIVPLRVCRKNGILMKEVKYTYDEDLDCYDVVKYIIK